MTGIEIPLLVTGVVFYVASFFVSEKLGPRELNKIGELSNREIRKVLERELQKVAADVKEKVEEKAGEALEDSAHSLDNECNERIKTINEYADTVVESMNKTHTEIMFLYSMLNDKHTELTQFSSRLQELAADLEKKDEEISRHLTQKTVAEEAKEIPRQTKTVKTPQPQKTQSQPVAVEEKAAQNHVEREEDLWPDGEPLDDLEEINHNEAILALHEEGKSSIEIARELMLGLGEVQLVIGLYEGKRKQ